MSLLQRQTDAGLPRTTPIFCDHAAVPGVVERYLVDGINGPRLPRQRYSCGDSRISKFSCTRPAAKPANGAGRVCASEETPVCLGWLEPVHQSP
jgi:hypothetical protein